MKHSIRKCSGKGDEVVAEWDTETVTKDELDKIEQEFNQKLKEGWLAGDLVGGELTDKFNPNTNTLMIPRIQGG